MSTPGSRENCPAPDGAASHRRTRDMPAPPFGTGTARVVTGRSHCPARPGTAAAVLRAAADFIDSAGVRSGVHVICGDGEVRIGVWEPFGDLTVRCEIVARLAVLIGGIVQQHDNRDCAISDLRADGTIGGLRVAVKTTLPVRRTRPRTGEGQPLAESPDGQVSAVSGKLPEGWRWVTALDAQSERPAPRKARRTAATTQESSQARQGTGAQPARPGSRTHRAPRQPPS